MTSPRLTLIFALLALCSFIAADEDFYNDAVWPAEKLEILPYLLHLESTEATLAWVTPAPTASRIVLRSAAGERTIQEDHPTAYHRIDLSNLEPDRYYQYEIDGFYRGRFKTPFDDVTFRMIAIGHTHGSKPLTHFPEELLISTIVDLDPDLVIHSGDVTYHPNDSDFNRYYFRLFEPLISQTPVYVAAGNHDSAFLLQGKVNFDSFRRLFPYDYGSERGAYYTFKYKNARFFALSYFTFLEGKDAAQYDWLRNQLRASESDFNIVFFGGANIPPEQLSKLFRILSDHRVELVLGGDGTGVSRQEIHGVPYFFTGASGGKPKSLRYLEFNGYYVTVRRMDATGKQYNELDIIRTLKNVTVVDDVMKPEKYAVDNQGGTAADLVLDYSTLRPRQTYLGFDGLRAGPESFDAVRLRLTAVGSGVGNIRLHWRGVADKTLFRLQSLPVEAGSSVDFLLTLPGRNPLTKEEYELEELRIYADSGSRKLVVTLDELSLVRVGDG